VPYIHPDQKLNISLGNLPIRTWGAGELNFKVTELVDMFLGDSLNYSRINEAIGALECAKLELYRRVAAPYEDKKIKENGDVYRNRD